MSDARPDAFEMPPPEAIAAFWRHFVEREAAFAAKPQSERINDVNDLLKEHFSGLVLELGGGQGEMTELVVTAEGHVELFPLVTELVAKAPPLRHHKAVAFRERSDDADFSIGMGGFDLAARDVLIAHAAHDGRVALEIKFAREIPGDLLDHAKNMTFIMLDHVLGEFDFAIKVGVVEFVESWSSAVSAAQPLSAYRESFDQFWRNGMGRTGVLPDGEAQWTGYEVSFGDPQDGDEGLVLVNDGANAVAMRADLSALVRLSAAVSDGDELQAVSDLQEQAGTLLTQKNLGIYTHSVWRGGMRTAYYYANDALQAKALMESLLARPLLREVELEYTYDPAWKRYLRFAA